MGAPILNNFCGKLANVLCTKILVPKSDDEKIGSYTQAKRRRKEPETNIELGYNTNVAPLALEYELPIEDFVNNYKCCSKPVLIKRAISHWPALSQSSSHFWNVTYIKNLAGYRTVPVEIGSRYTDDDWTQTLMTINDFVEKYVVNSSQNEKGYLAQHDLFSQISELKDDFEIPEYCYTGEDNDLENIALNIWFGPDKTVSPLHTDPKHNCLCQVFGKKYVRLYTEDQSEYLSAFENGVLTNTSQIDLEKNDEDILKTFPLYSKARGYECILEEGDILYIPPKCWHFVRSLSISCSLSFWFK